MKTNRPARFRRLLPLLAVCLLLAVTALADVSLPAGTTEIGDEAFLNDFLLTGTLQIPQGVTVIGDRAFEGCTSLTGLTLPEGLKRIESRAFAGCTGLTGTVRIPASVTYVAVDAFDGVPATIVTGGTSTDTDLPGTSTDTDLPGVSTGTDLPPATGTDLPEGISFEVTDEGAIITGYSGAVDAVLSLPAAINGIPVVAIGEGAFMGYDGLTGSVVIPASVKRIGESAFFGCASLDGVVVLNEGLEEIGEYAFFECFSLTGGLTLPDSMESVGESAFAFCESMTGSLVLNDSVALGKRCFQGAGFTGSLTVPATVTLDANVFSGTALAVTFEKPGFTFEQADSVVTITGYNGPLENGLTIPVRLGSGIVSGIASEAFADVGIKGPVVIPGNVVRIGNSAFRSNPGITSLTLNEGTVIIASYAFADCTGLSGVITLPSTAANVDETAFAGTDVTIGYAATE